MRLKKRASDRNFTKRSIIHNIFFSSLNNYFQRFYQFSFLSYILIFLIYETISLKIILRSYHLYYIHIRFEIYVTNVDINFYL